MGGIACPPSLPFQLLLLLALWACGSWWYRLALASGEPPPHLRCPSAPLLVPVAAILFSFGVRLREVCRSERQQFLWTWLSACWSSASQGALYSFAWPVPVVSLRKTYTHQFASVQ